MCARRLILFYSAVLCLDFAGSTVELNLLFPFNFRATYDLVGPSSLTDPVWRETLMVHSAVIASDFVVHLEVHMRPTRTLTYYRKLHVTGSQIKISQHKKD